MGSNIKFRPKDLSDIIGNRSIVTSLESILQSKDRPHAFLFTGKQGCGKTTLARILCKRLECSDHDLIEINISNNRGIDTARDIIQFAYVKPLDGKSRVYLLDEVHKSTNDFQNAILKVMEEPPEHLYFILCTTEPQKLLKTVISRCTEYVVSPLAPKKMARLLQTVTEKMKVKLSDVVSEKIIEKADGIPRDALILLDQVVSIKDKDSQLEAVERLKLDQTLIIDLCRALLEKKKWDIIRNILSSIEGDPEEIRRSVLGYFTKVFLNHGDPHAAMILEAFKDNFYDSGMAGAVLACYSLYI